jgi:hypothetical protein
LYLTTQFSIFVLYQSYTYENTDICNIFIVLNFKGSAQIYNVDKGSTTITVYTKLDPLQILQDFAFERNGTVEKKGNGIYETSYMQPAAQGLFLPLAYNILVKSIPNDSGYTVIIKGNLDITVSMNVLVNTGGQRQTTPAKAMRDSGASGYAGFWNLVAYAHLLNGALEFETIKGKKDCVFDLSKSFK